MSFDWLDKFNKTLQKQENYAEKTLAQYRLGMRAKGSIAGVRIEIGAKCCFICDALDTTTVFHPDEAPLIPPEKCEKGLACTCVYRPVMSYEVGE